VTGTADRDRHRDLAILARPGDVAALGTCWKCTGPACTGRRWASWSGQKTLTIGWPARGAHVPRMLVVRGIAAGGWVP